MRYKPIVIAGYLAICLWAIYSSAALDQAEEMWWLVALALVQPSLGLLLGTWWAFLVPMVLVPMSIPAAGGEILIWFGVLLGVAVAISLVILGSLARKLGEYSIRRTGSRSGVAVVGVALAAGVVAVTVVFTHEAVKSGNYSVPEASRFQDFPVFYSGREVAGDDLSAVFRNELEYRSDQVSVLFTYGKCEIEGSDEGCAPPIEIANEPACMRNFALYGDSAVAAPTRIRGAPASFFEGGSRLEIQTGETTIVIFGYTKRDVLAVAKTLRGVNVDVATEEPLPPPAPGAVEGKLPCRRP
jgi:hypothetical protein